MKKSSAFLIKADRKKNGIVEIVVSLDKSVLYRLSILDSVYAKAKDRYSKYKLIEILFSFVVEIVDAQTVRLAEDAVKAIEQVMEETK